jgi:hypothetical protein
MIFPHAADDHAAWRIIETYSVIVPLLQLLRSKLLGARYALACKPVNEFTTVCPHVLPWRVVPGSHLVKRRVETRFGIRLNVAFKKIAQRGIEVLIGLGLGVELQPWLDFGTNRGWIILAKVKYMPGPIWNRGHQGVAEWRLRSIAASC